MAYLYGTVSESGTGPVDYGSGTGPLDTDSRGPVRDPEPHLWGLFLGPVVCEMTTDKSRDTGPYLHVYVVTVILPTRHCLGVRYRTPRLRGYGFGTGHRATPMRTVSGSGSVWNNYSARLSIRGCVTIPARICSNCYFTNKNSCWSLTLLRPPSLIICIYCHAIQTSISLY